MRLRGTHRIGFLTALAAAVIALALPAAALANGSVTTGPATGVSTTSATLTGTIQGADSDSEYAFQYGTTTAYGKVTSAHSATSGDSTVSVIVTGLTANTTYHFRLVLVDAATDPASASAGSDGTFSTISSTPASARTGSATSVTRGAATVHGTITVPVAGAYLVQYGTTGKYGKATTAKVVAAGTHSVSVRLRGLKAGTTYHYRLVAADKPAGTVVAVAGSSRTFRTKKKATRKTARRAL